MQRKLFVKVDGFSNNYWGWGLEDDEFFARLMDGGASIERPPQLKSGKESTFKHIHSDKVNLRIQKAKLMVRPLLLIYYFNLY